MKNMIRIAYLTLLLLLSTDYHINAKIPADKKVLNVTILILDASFSMNEPLNKGKIKKIDLLHRSLNQYMEIIPKSTLLGIVGFFDCGDVEVLFKPGEPRWTKKELEEFIIPIGGTPITDAVEVAEDLLRETYSKFPNSKINSNLIVITDGEETCQPSESKKTPCKAIEYLIRINLVWEVPIIVMGNVSESYPCVKTNPAITMKIIKNESNALSEHGFITESLLSTHGIDNPIVMTEKYSGLDKVSWKNNDPNVPKISNSPSQTRVLMEDGLYMQEIPSGFYYAGPGYRIPIPTFWIHETEVTVSAFNLLSGKYQLPPLGFKDDSANYAIKGRENFPLNGVTWYEADRYCHSLCEKCRLPHLMEWEYAASGGSMAQYSLGADIPRKDKYCFNLESGQVSCKTKIFSSNSYNLYDMSGNLWEWVNTQSIFSNPDEIDPRELLMENEVHGIKGGSYLSGANSLRI